MQRIAFPMIDEEFFRRLAKFRSDGWRAVVKLFAEFLNLLETGRNLWYLADRRTGTGKHTPANKEKVKKPKPIYIPFQHFCV